MRRRAALLALAATLVLGPPSAAAEPPFTPTERAAMASVGLGAGNLNDVDLTASLLAFARTESGQRLRPESIDFRWTIAPRRRDVATELQAARTGSGLGAWLGSLSPPAAQYQALRQARARYADLAAGGGWGSLPEGPVLRLGDRSPDVPALRNRLALEGYDGGVSADTLFDPTLEATLRAYQEDHTLQADGALGPATRHALNVPAADRLMQIDANLERWRWLPPALPPDRVEVDTGFQQAVLYRGGLPVLRMRAIVGAPKHPTPMFVSAIDAVVFNPPWNVPASIAANELLPAAKRRPGLLASLGIRWVDGHLQQRPGPNNSLGQVKFDIRSRFGVYLHDTPGRGLFAQPVRAFSHGCMRLEKPRELAAALLSPQGGSTASVEAAIAQGVTRRMALSAPIPVYVLHWTVRAEGGRVSFRPDIYGWDRKLTDALAGGA